jgi:TonB family protein
MTIQDPCALVEVLVDTDGTVAQAEIIHSTGHRFDDLVIEAVKKWEFTRPEEDGRPITCYMKVPVRFRSKDK